jgi:hypothetical protein
MFTNLSKIHKASCQKVAVYERYGLEKAKTSLHFPWENLANDCPVNAAQD